MSYSDRSDGDKIPKSQLHKAINRKIKRKQDELGKRFMKAWHFTNPIG